MFVNLETVSNPSEDDPTPTLRNAEPMEETEPTPEDPEIIEEENLHPTIKVHDPSPPQAGPEHAEPQKNIHIEEGISSTRKKLYIDRPNVKHSFEQDDMRKKQLMKEQNASKHKETATPTSVAPFQPAPQDGYDWNRHLQILIMRT